MSPITSMKEMMGIIFLRFPWVIRLWAAYLVSINMVAIVFIDTIYGQVVLGTLILASIILNRIYSKFGYVRLLGIAHMVWIPMLVWIGLSLPMLSMNWNLYVWLCVLTITNSISLIIDSVDVIRYVLGDRQPHYEWSKKPELEIEPLPD